MTKNKKPNRQRFLEDYDSIATLPNVWLNFGPVQNENDHPLEQVYLSNIFRHLKQKREFSTFKFYVIGSQVPWEFQVDKNSVVFYMSNEDHVIPDRVLRARAVFTPYCPLVNKPVNVFPIPLGYNGSLSALPIKPINERSYDVFFSGNLHRRRLAFLLATRLFTFAARLKGRKYRVFIRFGRHFGGNLSPDRYSEILMDSKIALVPEGYLSNNSFRFFEAVKYGTVVLTKKLYDCDFYRNFPGYQLNSWFAMLKLVKRLLSDSRGLQEIHEATLSYFERQCAEKSVAHSIWRRIIEIR